MLNENIKRIREERGMTQKQLADKVGISGAFMSLIEKGTNKPSDENLKKIANALDVPVVDLIAEEIQSPEIELIELLIKLTKENKMIWSAGIKNDYYDRVVKYISIVNGSKYTIINADKLPLKVQNGLYYENIKNEDKGSIVECQFYYSKEIPKKLKELWNTIELTINDKTFIYDQIDELKKLLDEDKNADV